MTAHRRRIAGLIAMSSGTLLASACDAADQVLATIEFALRITDIWV